ncbi:MAG: ribose 5-phosphate isomerase B [Fimbriimonadia bacterium]|jgi:ribose 5-phosphate isomerase B
MRIALGSDHAGYELKERARAWLADRGFQTEDLGPSGLEAVDYPDFAHAVCDRVTGGKADLGVLVCKTGIGMCIAANKLPGIRAAHPANEEEAFLARSHNNANVLCLGGGTTDPDAAIAVLDMFVSTPFSNEERHIRRLAKIEALEQ